MKSGFASLPTSLRFILLYLLASPLFWLLDNWSGWGFRVAFMEDGIYKILYYSVLTVAGAVCYMRPALTALIALLESTVNLFLHFISFAIPIFTLSEQVLGDKALVPVITSQHILGFLLVGLILIMSFNSAVDALRRP